MSSVLINPYSFSSSPPLTVDFVADFGGSLASWNDWLGSKIVGNLAPNSNPAGNEWFNVGVSSFTPNTIIAPPNNDLTGSLVVENNSTNLHSREMAIYTKQTNSFTVSAYLKDNTAGFGFVALEDSTGTKSFYAIVNLSNGAVFGGQYNGGTITSVSAVAAGSGWYLVTATGSVNGPSRLATGLFAGPSNGVDARYAGNGTRSVYIADVRCLAAGVTYDPSVTDVRLNIPAGTYTGDDNLARHANGHTITLQGAGSATTNIVDPLGNFSGNTYIGLNHDLNGCNQNDYMPRIQTALTGQTTVTLVTTSDASRFSAGQWVEFMCFDLQGFGSYPPNNHFFEFNRIASVDAGTGVITLVDALKNDYLSTYPLITGGSGINVDQCGSATMLPIYNVHWDADMVVNDITNTNTGGFIGGNIRSVTWNRCSWPAWPSIASVSKTWIANDCEFPPGAAGFEVDKSVETIEFNGCTGTTNLILTQSSSVNHMEIRNSSLNSINTPKTATITNSTINFLGLGVSAYGASSSITVDNSNIVQLSEPIRHVDPNAVLSSHAGGVLSGTYTNIVGTNALLHWVPRPGTWYTMESNPGPAFYGMIGPTYQITDAVRTAPVGGDINYTTTLTGTEPRWAICDSLTVVACPELTVTNTTTGCFAGMSYPVAEGMAFGEYWNSGLITSGFNSDAGFWFDNSTVPFFDSTFSRFFRGHLTKITIDVVQAYTGIQPTLTLEPFISITTNVVDDNNNHSLYHPVFALHQAGTRVIQPGSTTGAQAGDSAINLSATPLSIYSLTQFGIKLNHDISAESPTVWPHFQIEVICDMGIS